MTIYNEMEFLPHVRDWCIKEGLDLYIIDNYSTDGSWEWLQKNQIRSHRINTNESFDLVKLQREIILTTDANEPDWVIYSGADTFFYFDVTIKRLLENAESMNVNIIELPLIDMCRTDEKGSAFECYFYRDAKPSLGYVYKWEPNITYTRDFVNLKRRRSLTAPGVMINYGRTKTPKERQILLRRRQRAWKNGLDRKAGRHYLRDKAKGWKWDKSELKDIRNSEYAKYIN